MNDHTKEYGYYTIIFEDGLKEVIKVDCLSKLHFYRFRRAYLTDIKSIEYQPLYDDYFSHVTMIIKE